MRILLTTISEFEFLWAWATYSPCLALQLIFLCFKLWHFGLTSLCRAHELALGNRTSLVAQSGEREKHKPREWQSSFRGTVPYLFLHFHQQGFVKNTPILTRPHAGLHCSTSELNAPRLKFQFCARPQQEIEFFYLCFLILNHGLWDAPPSRPWRHNKAQGLYMMPGPW